MPKALFEFVWNTGSKLGKIQWNCSGTFWFHSKVRFGPIFSLPKSSAKIQYIQFIAPEQAGNELFCSGTSWEWANWSAPHWNMVPEHTVTVSQWSQFQSGDFIADLNRSGPGKMKPIWSDQFWWRITTSNWTRTTFGFAHCARWVFLSPTPDFPIAKAQHHKPLKTPSYLGRSSYGISRAVWLEASRTPALLI